VSGWARHFRELFARLEAQGALDLSPVPVVRPGSASELALGCWYFEYLERRLWPGARAILWYTDQISGRWLYYALIEIEGTLGAAYGADGRDVLLHLRAAIEQLAPQAWWEKYGSDWGEWEAVR
jgi:hypothetical protein